MVEILGTDWFHALTTACQRLAGSTLNGDREAFAEGVERFRDDLPRARSAVERRVLEDCVSPAVWKGSHEPHALLTRWVREYLQTFERDDRWPAHWKVARHLEGHFREALDIVSLAHVFGRGRTALMRDFRRAFGFTIAAYQTRLRLRQAVVDLRIVDSNVEAVARLVGYRSPKNFYAAFKTATGLTPSDARNLTTPELRRLLDLKLGIIGTGGGTADGTTTGSIGTG